MKIRSIHKGKQIKIGMHLLIWTTVLLVCSINCGSEAVRQDKAVLLIDGRGRESLQNPAFSPDGQHILYTLFQKGYNQGPSRLWIIDSTGEDPSQLTPEAEDNDFMDVNLPGSCWNSETGRITFASDREDADEIWTMDSDGTDLFRVTHHTNPPYYLEPSFSPDGVWIVCELDYQDSCWEDGFRGEIWMVRSDGTELTRLIGSDSVDCRQPNWSPAGHRILYQQRELPDQHDWDIFTITPEADSLLNVTSSGSSDTDASFSPEGTEIVYSSDYGNLECPNIFIVPVEGGEPRRITFAEGYEDGAPSFSSDGRKIVFETHRGADEEEPACLMAIEISDE